MARSLARYESDAAGQQLDDQAAHYELQEIWMMMERLGRSIPQHERPTQAELIVAAAD